MFLPMEFEPFHFVENLRYMGLGLLGIFIVIGIIVGMTVLLNTLTQPKSDDPADKG